MALIAVDGCFYDEEQFARSHSYESLDLVGREAFVNHIHVGGKSRIFMADQKIQSWIAEMRKRWPDQPFRIYRQVQDDEVTIRFHAMRPDLPNWCEMGVEILTVNG